MIQVFGNNIMLNHELNQILKHWDYIAPYIHYPKNQKEYDKMITKLDELLSIVGEDENHKLMGLVDILSHFIEEYESKHSKQKMPKGIEALKFLLESHQLRQSDLSELGSQGVVSEILNGKRKLNLRQINVLSKKFSLDPSTFID